MDFRSLITIAAASILCVTSCGAKKEGKVQTSVTPIVMGTNAEFPPFESRGGSDGQTIVGFDVKIAEAIALKLQRPLKIEDMKFDALLPALNSGKVSFVMAGMTITDERKMNVDFSEPYYLATQTIVYRSGESAPTDTAALKGKKIGSVLGFTGNDIAVKIAGMSNVTSYNSAFEAIMDLKNSKVDFVIVDQQPALTIAAKNPEIALAQIPFAAESYGIAVKKGDSDLLTQINATLTELKANGTYDSLLAEYMK